MVNLRQTLVGVTATAMLLTAACASAPRRQAEAPPAAAARIQDSRPERIAAQRAGAPASLELEQSDERWGIEAARDRREAERQKKSATMAPPPTTPIPAAAPASP
jgi:uncharacterized protein YdaU (DUF1376 family)